MFYVDVLKSLKSSRKYVGATSQSVKQKLGEHSEGATRWTRGHRPYELLYAEKFLDKQAALRRERFFKTSNGRKTLDRIIESRSPPQGMAEKIL